MSHAVYIAAPGLFLEGAFVTVLHGQHAARPHDLDYLD